MRILAFNAGHDGAAVFVRDGALVFSFESEKNSFRRHSTVTASTVLNALAHVDEIPDVIAESGWVKGDTWRRVEAGYFGIGADDAIVRPTTVIGRPATYFSSTHEKAHLFAAYGLSPFPQRQPCYALVWEGLIGRFYEIDEHLGVTVLGQPMTAPGHRYAALFALADPSVLPTTHAPVGPECAGKLMALAAYGRTGTLTAPEQALITYLLDDPSLADGDRFDKCALADSPWFNAGVEADHFKDVAAKYSNALFDRFFQFAARHLTRRHPLLISGGCGLNGEWNSRWARCGLFPEVFVPPCANDSGSTIGTAIEAMHRFTGVAKLKWRVDAGHPFINDDADLRGIDVRPLVVDEVAAFLADGNVIAWVQGRCEIGPRALGQRSILAAPFSEDTRRRLNAIKQREGYRPIAPVCLEEDVSHHFDWYGPSPHMLFFQKVLSPDLRAVTHVDDSARVQTVSREQHPRLHDLLRAFKHHTGFGVLCNTSLNFKGSGFINQKSDLVEYVRSHGLDGFVIADEFFTVRRES